MPILTPPSLPATSRREKVDQIDHALRSLTDEAVGAVADFAKALSRRQAEQARARPPADPPATSVPSDAGTTRRLKNMSWIGSASHIESDLDSVELMDEANRSRGEI